MNEETSRLRELRRGIVTAVHSGEPGAEVVLYGSRARGDARPDSDWNLLILVDGPVDPARETAIRHRLYDFELGLDEVLAARISSHRDWERRRGMPLYEEVRRDGIVLTAADWETHLPTGGTVGAPPKAETRHKLRQLRSPIREAVHEIAPEAEIILYGSRARGDARSDSDWDLLVLVDGDVDESRRDAIRHRIYRVERTLDEVLCPIVVSRQDWASPNYRAMPFAENVERDGVPL